MNRLGSVDEFGSGEPFLFERSTFGVQGSQFDIEGHQHRVITGLLGHARVQLLLLARQP